MSTVEASATADAVEAAVRTKTYSPRTIPVFGVVTQHEDSQGIFKPMDLNHIIKLLEETDKDDLEEKQLDCVKKLVHCYQNGFPLRDLAQVFKILGLCADKIERQPCFVEPASELIKLCGLPFLKKKVSDEITYTEDTANSLALLGELMKIPSSKLRIQICKCIIDFYHAEPPKKHIPGYQQVSSSYKIKMAEVGGLAKAMVQSVLLLENQLVEKLWVLKVLQHLSTSEVNCTLMVKGQAASRICARLNDPDPSGQLLFRSSEILWNLLERSSKEEIIQQLSNLECLLALKEIFKNLFMRGHSHYDRQLRNDILVITTIIAQNPGAPMIECGFTRDLILFATFNEVKSQNPLVKNLKLSNSYEDFELKKLLFNIIVILCKDLTTVQLLIDGNVILALFTYVKKPEKLKIVEWSAAQYEELQLHAIATLSSVAPLLIEEYMACQGNARILAFLEWCEHEDSFFIHGNSFHGTGGRGNKFAQMRYTLRLLRAMVYLEDETVNTDLCERGIIRQLIDTKKPLFTSFQEEQKITPLPANCPSVAVMDVAENIRAKIYAVLGKLDFENLPGLSAEDFVTLCIIHRYLDFKIGEIWNEVCEEIKLEKLRLVTSDKMSLESITAATENIGKMVASLQSEMIESQARQDVQNEQRVYAKIQATHKQRELANKSWTNFLARTSNAKTLKKAKRLQEKAIESSKYSERPQNAIFHQTVIKGLNTTVPSGRVVTVESTPARLLGGPLADTDIALRKLPIRGGALQRVKAKAPNEPKKSVPTQ
uniref:Cilia and flagella associated protein 69 n=1 Tax=Peromyscus maniculatus bairdii TaxID=230844 RepID=A0A8C8T8H8_PERMB